MFWEQNNSKDEPLGTDEDALWLQDRERVNGLTYSEWRYKLLHDYYNDN